LEEATHTRAFTVWAATNLQAFQPDVAAWHAPALAILRGTVLGARDFADYDQHSVRWIAIGADGRPDFSHPIARDRWRTLAMEDQLDAVLYLGSTLTPTGVLRPDMCIDTGFVPVLRQRMALVQLKPEFDRLNDYCASHPR
jgi:hypothetical protein